MSITYHKKTKKRLKKHGFRHRMKSTAGKSIINKRRRNGRTSLSTSDRK
jgi:large subunit ribosomal protein L34